ncbi:MAG: tRNA (adenosine(37)-N6)-dimethylallyltransferase MiaA [Actinomycetota bacterium]
MTTVAALVGPTAVGKSSAAIEVAERIDAEVVSIDSMQVYRGMDIGTDKVSAEDRQRVRHHLLDLRDPSHDLTVAEFQDLARAAIDEIHARGRIPLLVGGSGLYFRAVVDDLDFPPRSPEVRAALEERIELEGPAPLYAELAERDPVAAARIEPANARRIVRALEVVQLTGRPFSANDAWDRYESRYDLRVAGLERPPEVLHERIEERVRQMLERGLIEETRALAEAGLGVTARQALGYRQVLEMSEATVEELHREISKATKRFARRQRSWFRADPRIRWFDAASATLIDDLEGFFGGKGAVP